MAATNQKLRLLFLRNYLLNETDEEHMVTLANIQSVLTKAGYDAERKTVYSDLASLTEAGLDIIRVKSSDNLTLYYVASREFELPELKLLVDSVQSSRFITAKKTRNLIRKVESLGSRHQARALQRQVIVSGRLKNMNESVFYTVDGLSSAISGNHSVMFRYYEYNLRKEHVFRKHGAYYHVSPYALILDNENYYLLGYDEEDEVMKHFRVDKIASLQERTDRRKGADAFKAIDLSRYTSMMFGMYHGEKRQVRLIFANHLVGAVIDRFGKEIRITEEDDGHFSFLAEVSVSPQFFGWLMSFGDEASVLEPADVREEYLEHIKRAVSFTESLK